MDARTLEALRGSILKWEAIVAGTGEDLFGSNCPLCQLFLKTECRGCPVAEYSGDTGCWNTPWEEWDCLIIDDDESLMRVANTPERKRLAQAELDFLRSLLPVEAEAA